MYTCFLAVFKPSAIESAIQPFANSPTALCKRSIAPYGVPPLAFATAPRGGSNPLEHLPVGADLLSCKKQAVNGGKKIFFATFLQAKKQAIDSLLYAWFL